MKNQIITFRTYFSEDSNQANISKILTRELDFNNPDPVNLTGVHQSYLYEDYSMSKLNFIKIRGVGLGVREKEVFNLGNNLLKTLDNFTLENFTIWLWEMKTSSYKKFRKWSEIPDSQNTLGIMHIIYDNVKTKEYNDDQNYIDFEVILKPSAFKSISNKLLNKKEDVEYDFFFKVESIIDDPPEEKSYSNSILDFEIIKRPASY